MSERPEWSSLPPEEVWPRIAAAGTAAWRDKLWKSYWSYMVKLRDEGVLVHEGDLEADSLAVGPQIMVVTGNLRVSGLLKDCQDADETLLVVLGDLDAGNVATYWAVFVAGDVRIREVLYGFSSDDAEFCVAGGLTVPAVVDGDHHVEVHGAADVGLLTGHGNGITADRRPRQVLDPHEALAEGAYEVLEIDEDDGTVIYSGVDRDALRRRLNAGERVLASRD